MADPVKISELPAISSVQPNDIIPVVDAALTQTSKCTASQIAAIGGGPPGDGTVTTVKIVDAAVTYAKIQNVPADRLLGRSATSAGPVQEITCTPFARTLLDDADAAAARLTLGALASTVSPEFSGTATFTGKIENASGSVLAPSYSFSGDTDTGFYRPSANTVSIVTGGIERLRVAGDGSMSSPIIGGTTLLPAAMCRAWVNFHGGANFNPPSFYIGSASMARASVNVSSVVYHGLGDYTVNLATPMPDVNYCVCAFPSRDNNGGYWGFTVEGTASLNTESSIRLRVGVPNTSGPIAYNSPVVCVSVFR